MIFSTLDLQLTCEQGGAVHEAMRVLNWFIVDWFPSSFERLIQILGSEYLNDLRPYLVVSTFGMSTVQAVVYLKL